MGSDSSESSVGAVNVELDIDRVVCLASKVIRLLFRKGRGRNRRVDLLNEYWALRLAVLSYESLLCPNFDNEAEIVALLKRLASTAWEI